MKVLFLDIDGVLNHQLTENRVCGFVGLDPELIAIFNKIVDAVPDLKIVVSSTWRKTRMSGVYDDFPGLIKLLGARGLKGEIIDRTPDHRGGWRGAEISTWLADNKDKDVTHYVILDDGMDAGYGHPGKYVQTYWHIYGSPWNENKDDPRGGLLDRHVAQALEILGVKP